MDETDPEFSVLCRVCDLMGTARCRHCPTRWAAVRMAAWSWRLTIAYASGVLAVATVLTVGGHL